MFDEILQTTLREMRLEDLIEKTAKFLLDKNPNEGNIKYCQIHNKLLEIFGRGIPWKEDLKKIHECKEIEILTKTDSDAFDEAIKAAILQFTQIIELLQSKENLLLHLLVDKEIKWTEFDANGEILKK
jgi:hypothetical protein